jgi:hypothetical protein
MMGGKISIDQQAFEAKPAVGACLGVAAAVGAGIGFASSSLALGVGLGTGLLVFMVVALCRGDHR